MSFRAGQLNRRIKLQLRAVGSDAAGQPNGAWTDVPNGELWAAIANETGLGAIRSSVAGNVPADIARYSFLIRFEAIARLGINANMRLLHDGEIFEVKGTTRDFKDRDKAYIICEQGGNAG